jgi:hypothetical protein
MYTAGRPIEVLLSVTMWLVAVAAPLLMRKVFTTGFMAGQPPTHSANTPSTVAIAVPEKAERTPSHFLFMNSSPFAGTGRALFALREGLPSVPVNNPGFVPTHVYQHIKYTEKLTKR